jgi:hypothetical protein
MLQAESMGMRREIKRLREELASAKRRDRQLIAEQVDALRTARSTLESRIELLSAQVTAIRTARS